MRSRVAHLLLAASFASLLTVSASAGTAYACDCAIAAPEENLARADVAFEGTVAVVAIAPGMPDRDPSLDPIAVTFVVETLLKGPGESNEISVSTANNSAACGIAFAAGERWRIYATLVPGGGLETGSCSGDELLGQGTIPERAASGPPVTLLVVGGITAALVAFSAWAFTRRPRGESA
ncbi:MAG: hypothetical protein M3P32_05935 [Chloroflexota bacterium]|nr:hypothetical protein [Chloroflexota bacterium]